MYSRNCRTSDEWLGTWSLQPTTVSGKIRWTVEVERGSARLTILITVTNVGPVATSFEANYALAQ